MTLAQALARDAADPLAPLRARFDLDDDIVYLDGNSLGVPLKSARAALDRVATEQWGRGLVSSWNAHDWIGLPERVGARIAPLIGAKPHEVIVADSVSVNLFKLIAAALTARPGRSTILTEPGNFPTDLYIANGVAGMMDGRRVRAVAADDIVAAIDADTAVVVLTHVHYKTGRRLDMAAVTAAAHAHGALMLWDLSHSVGAVPLDLNGCGVDLAVGCGYKYLNGGPGAPGFLFADVELHNTLRSPLSGWMGHANPFAFDDGYCPAPGLRRFLAGTPPILSMAALDDALTMFDGLDLGALFAKSAALCDYFIAQIETRCATFGFDLISPRDPCTRGSHVSFAHPQAYMVCQALIARRVVGDFRAPDVLRMGFAPLYNSFTDVWRAADVLTDIMATGAWDDAQFQARNRVT